MPNWTYNELKVNIDSEQDLKQFYENNKNESSELSFNCAVPLADSDNREANWGCKWDASDVGITLNSNSIKYCFNTPWYYPDMWFKAITQKYPLFRFEIVSSYEGGEPTTKVIFENGKYSYFTLSGWISCDESFNAL